MAVTVANKVFTAWDLIGFDGGTFFNPATGQWFDETASVRIVGGRTLYEAVVFNDSTPGTQVRLDRLGVDRRGLRTITRYVDPDTLLEVVPG